MGDGVMVCWQPQPGREGKGRRNRGIDHRLAMVAFWVTIVPAVLFEPSLPYEVDFPDPDSFRFHHFLRGR